MGFLSGLVDIIGSTMEKAQDIAVKEMDKQDDTYELYSYKLSKMSDDEKISFIKKEIKRGGAGSTGATKGKYEALNEAINELGMSKSDFRS